jgi:hypothetical protein
LIRKEVVDIVIDKTKPTLTFLFSQMESLSLTLEMKFFAQITQLKQVIESLQMEKMELWRRVRFIELSKVEDTILREEQIMNLKYENLKLQEQNNNLRMENQAMKTHADAMEIE